MNKKIIFFYLIFLQASNLIFSTDANAGLVAKDQKWMKEKLNLCFLDVPNQLVKWKNKISLKTYSASKILDEKKIQVEKIRPFPQALKKIIIDNVLPTINDSGIKISINPIGNNQINDEKFYDCSKLADANANPDVVLVYSTSAQEIIEVGHIGFQNKFPINTIRINEGGINLISGQILKTLNQLNVVRSYSDAVKHNRNAKYFEELKNRYFHLFLVETFTHEFLHILGLCHEQLRHDGKEINIFKDFSVDHQWSLFYNPQQKLYVEKFKHAYEKLTFVGKYDLLSLMNVYRADFRMFLIKNMAFCEKSSVKELMILACATDPKKLILQLSGLSFGDYLALEYLYGLDTKNEKVTILDKYSSLETELMEYLKNIHQWNYRLYLP